VVVQALGLQEDLVAGAIGEADDLVLDGGAVARALAGGAAAVDGGFVQPLGDDAVGRWWR
jgi:hypothetical protein